MKQVVFYSLIAFFSLNYSMANTHEEKYQKLVYEYNMLHFDFNNLQNIDVELLAIEIDEFSCTRSIKVYIPTEAGIIGIGLSITASTCEEADNGIADAIRGFVRGIF